MRILIKVTKEILEKSAYCKISDVATNCAIACAIRDLLPNAYVRDSYISFFKGAQFDWSFIGRANLPLEAVLFIREFDDCQPEERKQMIPTSFEIDVPDELIESIGISEAERIISNSLTMEKV